MSKFNHKALAIAIASIGAISTAHAAGLDRSGQDVSAFLQDGTYAEAVYTYIDADVSGKDTSGNDTGDMAESYDFFRYGVKADINDTFSVGVLYDEPFGAAVQYEGSNNFVGQNATNTYATIAGNASAILSYGDALAIAGGGSPVTAVTNFSNYYQSQGDSAEVANAKAAATVQNLATAAAASTRAAGKAGEGTNVEIRTNNLTMLLGAKFGQNKNFQIYGGPAAQRLNGEVHLRGPAYSVMTGYDAKIKQDTQVGWVAGVAYSKPEIALKAALTYRSEIEHESTIAEVIPVSGYNSPANFNVTLPESWNLDFQTGVNPTTLLTAKVRYVPWSDFKIEPTAYTNLTKLPIVSYDKDQWQAEIGLGKKLNDTVSVQGSVGYDSGAGNPATTLGPIDGYCSVGLGAKVNVTPEWSVSLGGKYFKFGDADAALPNGTKVGRFEGNDGYAIGVKLAYQAK